MYTQEIADSLCTCVVQSIHVVCDWTLKQEFKILDVDNGTLYVVHSEITDNLHMYARCA